MTNPLYNLKSLAPNTYVLAKFDADFNVLAVYNLTPKGHSFTCDCPANQRSVVTKPCKHKRFLPFMLGAVNTDRFFDPETGVWCQPLGDMHRVPPEEEVVGEAVQAEVDADTLLAPVEPPEGLVGEALGSSIPADVEPTYVVPESSPNLAEFKALADTGAIKLAVQGPIPASPSAPTVRRR